MNQQEAIVFSMTKKERKNPDILNASRKKRIASGSGTSVQQVNMLIKQYMQISTMIKKASQMDQKSFLRSGFRKFFFLTKPLCKLYIETSSIIIKIFPLCKALTQVCQRIT